MRKAKVNNSRKTALNKGLGKALRFHSRKRMAAAKTAGLEAPEAAPGPN